MSTPLDDVCCAFLPAAGLAALAPVRIRPGVRLEQEADRVWVFWDAPDEEVLQCVLAVQGVELFAQREGSWYRPGAHLPSFHLPLAEEAIPLRNVLTPAPVVPTPTPDPSFRPVTLTLVRDTQPRKATALCCRLA